MEKSALGLPEACRCLREKTGVRITYRRLYSAVLDGTIPAMKDRGRSRWVIKTDDLDAIANAFGDRGHGESVDAREAKNRGIDP